MALIFLVFLVGYIFYCNFFQIERVSLSLDDAGDFVIENKAEYNLEKNIDLATDFFPELADVDLSSERQEQDVSPKMQVAYNKCCSNDVPEDLIEKASGKIAINVDEVSMFEPKRQPLAQKMAKDLPELTMKKASFGIDDITSHKLEERSFFSIEDEVQAKKKVVVKKKKKPKIKKSKKRKQKTKKQKKEVKPARKKAEKRVEEKVCCYPLQAIPEKGILFLGRIYNHLTVEYPWRKWIVGGAFHTTLTYDAFDSCGQEIPLSCLLFGNFKIRDIFLLSKLSDCGKLFRFETDAIYEVLTQLGRDVCGYSREQQDLAYLAPYDIRICAEKREKKIDLGAIYSFCVSECRGINGAVGFNLPIKSVKHIMNVDVLGVNLLHYGFTAKQIEEVIAQYGKSFIDLKDFFNRIILAPKGICLCELQNKFGVGDVSLFTLFDFANAFKRVDGFQLGAGVIFPVSRTSNPNRIWEPTLGTEAYWIGFSGNILAKVTPYFNPSASIGVKFSLPFKSCRRVPKLKKQLQDERVQAKYIDDLIVPCDLINPSYADYWVEQFCEFDSCVKGFADEAFNTETNLGNILEFNLGNYFYNVFATDFMINIFYEFTYKGKDEVCVLGTSGTFNTNLLEQNTRSTSHGISWNVSYIGKEGIEMSVGSKHTIAGTNTPKDHEITVSVVFAF